MQRGGIETNPVYITMANPDNGRTALEYMLRGLEQEAENAGWDLEPQMYGLSRISGYPHLLATPVQLPKGVLLDPARTLPLYVGWLREEYDTDGEGNPLMSPFFKAIGGAKYSIYQAMRAYRIEDSEAQFVGVVFRHEGWTVPNSHERVEEFRARTVHLAPDRIESRFLIAVCTDGQLAKVYRTRGNEPEYMDSLKAPDETPIQFAGTIPDTLRLHCDLVERVLAAGEPERMS